MVLCTSEDLWEVGNMVLYVLWLHKILEVCDVLFSFALYEIIILKI
jgi:hypothetical protein